MSEYYLVIKSLHIISIIAWMVGLLYLPRLFVYHVDAEQGSELDKTLQTMERKLLRFIMTPAMIASLLFGILLIFVIGAENLGGWFHAKSLALLGLFGLHGMMAKFRKDFASGNNKHSRKFYKIFNEIPTALMIAIVFLAIMKPF